MFPQPKRQGVTVYCAGALSSPVRTPTLMDRRDFLWRSALVAGGLVVGVPRVTGAGAVRPGSATDRELAMRALDAARAAGAHYADVRISANRSQTVTTRERQITGFTDTETYGFGVRVLVDGTWGFAASREVTEAEVVVVARQAVEQARAHRVARLRPVELAPVEV